MFNDPTFPGYDILYPLDWIATILSLLGSLVMSYLTCRLPSPLSTSVKFILAISIADFLYSSSNVISAFESSETKTMCYIEAILRHSSYISSVFFSCCVAIVSYKSFLPESNFNPHLFFKRAIIIGPLFNVLHNIALPLLFPQYLQNGDNGNVNCSLIPQPHLTIREKVIFYMIVRGGPILLGLIIIFKGYYNTIRELKMLPEGFIVQMNFSVYKLLWYPTVLLIVFMPSLVDQLISLFYPRRPIWLTALRVGITHSIGFTNGIMYIMLRKLYNTPDRISARSSDKIRETRSQSSGSLKDELLRAGGEL